MTDTVESIEDENNRREQRFCLAEGLLNHIEDHLRLHNGKLRMCLINDIMRYSLRQYEMGWNAAIGQINNNLNLRGLWFHETDGTVRVDCRRLSHMLYFLAGA